MDWGTWINYSWLIVLTIAMLVIAYVIAVILTEIDNLREEIRNQD